MRYPIFRTIALILACSLNQTAMAADAIDEAQQLLSAGQAGPAYERLSAIEAANAGNPKFDYLLGISALDSGRLTRAIFALERAIEQDPGNPLIRAELARAYYLAGEVDAAKAQFAIVESASSQVPEGARSTVRRFLSNIELMKSRQNSRFAGYLEAGLGHDSNVNSATSATQLAIPSLGGIIFTLDDSSTRKSSPFAQFGAGANLRSPLTPEWTFLAQASLQQSLNQNARRYDFGNLNASAGLSFSSDRSEWAGALHLGSNWLDGSAYRRLSGASLQWQYAVDANSQVSVYGQFAVNTYPGQRLRDTQREVLGAGYARSFGDNLPAVYVSVYVGDEDETDASVPQVGNGLAGLRAGMERRFGQSVLGFLNVAIEHRRHRATEPFFLRSRADDQYSLHAGAHYEIDRDWRLTPQVSLTRNRSNVEIFKFERASASIMLRRQF